MMTTLAYIGPDTMLPVASALAAAIGGILFAWRWIAGWFRSAARFVTGRPPVDAESPSVSAEAPDLGEHLAAPPAQGAEDPIGARK